MKKKLIIFDLDGTLIDTLDDLKESVNFALSHFSFPLRTREQVRKDIGNGVAKLMERSTPDGLNNPHYEEALEIFKKHYAIHYADQTKPYEGIVNTVKELRTAGFLLSVCTNKIDDVAHILIEGMFPGLFHFILGDIDGVPKKPAPNMINNILSHFGLNKEDAVYIGDTNVDEETALNSGLDYFLLTYGYRTKEELLNTCKGRNFLNSPKEILEHFKSEI